MMCTNDTGEDRASPGFSGFLRLTNLPIAREYGGLPGELPPLGRMLRFT